MLINKKLIDSDKKIQSIALIILMAILENCIENILEFQSFRSGSKVQLKENLKKKLNN